jgi:hypothetical protein
VCGLDHLADGSDRHTDVLAIKRKGAMRDARNDSMQAFGREGGHFGLRPCPLRSGVLPGTSSQNQHRRIVETAYAAHLIARLNHP